MKLIELIEFIWLIELILDSRETRLHMLTHPAKERNHFFQFYQFYQVIQFYQYLELIQLIPAISGSSSINTINDNYWMNWMMHRIDSIDRIVSRFQGDSITVADWSSWWQESIFSILWTVSIHTIHSNPSLIRIDRSDSCDFGNQLYMFYQF